jgi:hypothetical protein
VYSEEFAHVQLPVTSLETLPAIDGTNRILCVGHFNALCILHNGKVCFSQIAFISRIISHAALL